ncbi:MAG TPA: helix-turn-helix domain-containing protein, partial [Gammaproteobacteria bacterium]|nr:helix-turn-helix domain-containing protein [Gammaproteobacteria bacterium]
PIDVRILAATNRDLETEISDGRFRADLFYRLETFSLEVPPLRDRGDDIDLLAAHFLSHHATQAGVSVHSIDTEAMECLRRYSFPGNVRELSNAIERAVAFSRHEILALSDLPSRIRGQEALPPHAPLNEAVLFDPQRPPPLRIVEKRYVEHMLKHTGNNKQKAARLLGIGRRTLYRYLEPDQ